MSYHSELDILIREEQQRREAVTELPRKKHPDYNPDPMTYEPEIAVHIGKEKSPMKVTRRGEGWIWLVAGIWITLISLTGDITGFAPIDFDDWFLIALGCFLVFRISRW